MFSENISYLCSVKEEKTKKQRCQTRTSKRGVHKKMKIMKKNVNETIVMLQYRIKRYHAMGNGAKCQALNFQLQRLLAQQTAM